MKRVLIFFVLIGLCLSCYGQIPLLKKEIEKVISDKKAIVGISLYNFTSGDTLSICGNCRFPMQSVFKFPVALAILSEVDKGKLNLKKSIFIAKEQLLTDTWSPLREKYPDGNIYLPLSELIEFAVAKSDNNGCDILLNLLGGPEAVNNYLCQQGINGIQIKNNEQQIQASWKVQFNNWATPLGIVELLKMFYKGNLLSKTSFSFIWEVMERTSTGSIKQKLPQNAVIAHKTGSSGKNEHGITAATNDVGIMIAPNGDLLAFAFFITQSSEETDVNYEIIADIAKAIFDYYP